MISYYKNTIIGLITKLKELHKDNSNLELLLDIQISLVGKIKYIERRISSIKQEEKLIRKKISQSRLTKKEAERFKFDRDGLQNTIQEYRWLLFVFRTIGDGIAFSYFSKWDIKSLAYKDTSPDIKESSGFISGKSGLRTELKILRTANEYGIPALLTDLTNCIKHGDICFMNSSVPRLLEVKSSKNKSARAYRQIESLKNIQSYLLTDEAVGLRGVSYIQRKNVYSPEINHIDTVNELIVSALRNQFACKLVEPGVLYYVQLPNTDIQHLQECSRSINSPIIYYLNTLKNDSQWINYYPFTLSIQRPNDVYQFLCGEIQIVVLVDFDLINRYAEKRSLEAKMFDKDDLAFMKESLRKKGENMPFTNDSFGSEMVGSMILFRNKNFDIPENSLSVSLHYLGRAAYEFISLSWLLDQGFLRYDDMVSNK